MRVPKTTMLPSIALFCFCAISALGAQSGDATGLPPLPLNFAATAVGQAGPAAGKTFGVTIFITGWTTDAEEQEFSATLKSKGPDALVSALEKAKDVGRVAPTGSTGTGFRIARYHTSPGGGQHIVLVTNRPMSFGELVNGTRSTQYQFGIVVLDLDKDGKGSGILAPACKIKFNKQGQREIEYYGQKPWKLVNVRPNK